MHHPTQIDHNRLIDAADALLKAIESEEVADQLITMLVHEENGTGTRPADWFTEAELVEAMDLLIRLGLAPRMGGSRRSSPES
jgi:hypothetical protein